MRRTPGEIRELLFEINTDLQGAIANAGMLEEVREYTELQRAVADLQDRVGRLIDAGVEFLSAVWDAVEVAAKEFWRWLNGKK